MYAFGSGTANTDIEVLSQKMNTFVLVYSVGFKNLNSDIKKEKQGSLSVEHHSFVIEICTICFLGRAKTTIVRNQILRRK